MDEDVLDVKRWIQYAQEDYDSAVAMAKAIGNPYSPRKVCYDCQQSAEKILKAYMIAKEGTRSKMHDLEKLLRMCEKHSSDFNGLETACLELDTYVTETRYPSDKNLTMDDMNDALKYAGEILEFTKSKLAEMGFGA